MDNFFSIFFKAFTLIFAFALITGVLRRIFTNKAVKYLIEMPADNKARIIRSYQMLIEMWKMLFLILPLFLLIIPAIMFFIPYLIPEVKDDFHQLLLIYGSVMGVITLYAVDDFFYRRKVLKALGITVKGVSHD